MKLAEERHRRSRDEQRADWPDRARRRECRCGRQPGAMRQPEMRRSFRAFRMRATRSAETTKRRRVDGDRERRRQPRDERAAECGTGDLGDGVDGLALAVCVEQAVATHEVGDEHVVGELEQHAWRSPVTAATAIQERQRQRAVPTRQAGSTRSATQRTRSAPISTGRRRWRSTKPPPTQASSARGSVSCSARKPEIERAGAATRIAAIGSAVRVTREPTAEMPCALHSSRKSRCRHRPGVRRPRARDAQ